MNVAQLRKKSGLNQTEFYKRIGVTQSAGSRYESGRRLPKPLLMLIATAYGTERERTKALASLRGGK